jgi:hypothetical protein
MRTRSLQSYRPAAMRALNTSVFSMEFKIISPRIGPRNDRCHQSPITLPIVMRFFRSQSTYARACEIEST